MAKIFLPEFLPSEQQELNLAYCSEYVLTPPESYDADVTVIRKSASLSRKSTERTISSPLVSVKPRFNSTDLEQRLLARINQVRSESIHVYEAGLYKICKVYNLDICGDEMDLELLDNMHHIYQLKQMELDLSEEDCAALHLNIEDVIDWKPKALTQYKLYVEITRLVSALCIKWGVARYEDYSYRYSARVCNVKMLDMSHLNADVFTVEALWLAVVCKFSPLSEMVDFTVKQYAKLVRLTMNRVVKAIVSLNFEADFQATPSIQGYYAAKYPKIAATQHWQPDCIALPTEHHQLSQPEGVIASCFKSKYQKVNQQLKRLLEDFELCYRSFERALISCLLVVKELPL
jgi:hypothetical protein